MPGKKKGATEKKGAAKSSPSPASANTTTSKSVTDSIATLRSAIGSTIGTEALPDPLAVTNVDVCPTGLIALDVALGVGGWPRGRITTLSGPQHAGKTALALLALAMEQARDPEYIGAIIDIEQAYSESFAKLFGVDPQRLLVIRPETAEEALKTALVLMGFDTKDDGRNWTKSNRMPVTCIIYDSWGGSATEEVGLAVLARVGSMWLPKIASKVARTNTLFFLINQIREKPGVMFGNPEYEPGGRAIEHARSVQIQVHKVGEVEKDSMGTRIGHTIKVHIAKNKLAPPFKTIHAGLNYFTGFDVIADAFSAMQSIGMNFKLREGGNVLVFNDPETNEELIHETGEKAFLNALRTDPESAQKFIEHATNMVKALS